MKNQTIKQLVDQGITITLNGGMYEVLKSGESVTIFKSFEDAIDYAGKQVAIGETMVGFNETGEITLDDVIRQLELLPDDGSCDEYTNDCIRFAIKYIKGSVLTDNVVKDEKYPLPALCDGECGNVYEWKHLNHIDDPNSDEVLKFCRQCAFTFVARMTQISKEEDFPPMDEIRKSCGEELD